MSGLSSPSLCLWASDPGVSRGLVAHDGRSERKDRHGHLLRMLLRLARALLISVVALWAAAAGAQDSDITGGGSTAGKATCFGRFMNPITDLCWLCIFPISIGGASFSAGQEDIENPGSPVCICPMAVPPFFRIGLEIGFWEPTRIIEHTRTPFCFPELGGFYMDTGLSAAPRGGRSDTSSDGVARDSFYQTHVYVNPVLFYLNLLQDAVCLELGSFDLAYMSEYDPAWHDDVLTAVFEPEATQFANLLAVAACAADCVAASLGFPLAPLFWCSGCNGTVYPMNGNVTVHIGGVQASSLLTHRILAKEHRLLLAWQWHGALAMCQGYPQPVMDKRGYKTQMVYPIAINPTYDGQGVHCCQPLGRTTVLWGMGREFPVKGEDFAYQVFRKRNCCVTPLPKSGK